VTAPSAQDDLICLVADRSIEAAIVGLLSRPKAIGIRRVEYVIRPHPERDPGCYRHAHNFLSAFRKRYAHALVIFDREGCGNEGRSREELEEEVEGRLAGGGWRDRVRAVVLDPELECWVWSDSPHVDAALGWQGRTPALRSWLVENDFLAEGTTKPTRPKEAMEAAKGGNGSRDATRAQVALFVHLPRAGRKRQRATLHRSGISETPDHAAAVVSRAVAIAFLEADDDRMNSLAAACTIVAVAAAADPSYRIEMTPARRIEAQLTTQIDVPAMRGRNDECP